MVVPMMLDEWATHWGIPAAAIADLRNRIGIGEPTSHSDPSISSEAAVQMDVRAEAAEHGARLWRNNVGAGHIVETGSFLRWGLCNESEAMNAALKSSDLIGIRPILIGPQHLGRTIGQFLAREVKAAGWRYRGTKREQGQLNFLNLVNKFGGDAAFASGRGTI